MTTTSARLIAVKIKSANKNIFRALLSLASANLLIRVIGLLNQIIVSARFGQDMHMDAYYVASLIPTTVAPMLASAMEASVIPVYAHLRQKGTNEQASRLFSTLLNLLIILSILLTAAMLLFQVPLLSILAPGIRVSAPATFTIARSLAPFIFPILGLMVLNSFMECLLNADGKFGWPAYAGMLVPLTTATCVLVGGNSIGVLMLCIGSVIGQLLQLGVIIYRAHKAHIVYHPVMDLHIPELKPILAAAWPAFFAGLISMMSPLVDTFFGSYQHEGTIAALNNALKLNSVPTGVIFSAVGRAALPYLSNQAAIKDMKAFKGTLRLYLWIVGLATLALTFMMTFGAWIIVALIFEHGRFNAQDTNQTAWILAGLSIGMFPTAIGFIVSRAFSALGRTRILMGVSLFSMIANAAFDAIFGRLWGGFGIAFATSLYYFCTMIILIVTLRIMIGKLQLLTPPKELREIVRKISRGQYHRQWGKWKNTVGTNMGITYALRKQMLRVGFAVSVFALGTAGAISNATLTVRIAFGSILVLSLFRYQYLLLIAWACINVFIGSSLPLFNGNNLLSGLTLPTLLLLFYVPTKEAFKRMPSLPFWLAYFIWILLSLNISPVPLQQFMTLWTTQLDFFAVSVLVIILIDNRQKLLLFIDAMIAPAIFIALYGLWGFTTHQHGVVDTTTGYFRISSIFMDTPPTLGLYLSVLIPIVIYRLFTLRGLIKICAGIAVLLLLLLALGLTFNRGTLLAVAVGLVITVLFLPSNKIKGLAIGGGTAIIGLIFLATTLANIPLLSRFANSDISSLNGRTYLWQAIIDHFDPAQLMGNGMESSNVLLTNLKVGFGGGIIATAAHNIYLESMYEHGIIGLTLMLLGFASIGYLLLRKYKGAGYEQKMLIAGAFGTFISIVIQGYESNDIWNQAVGIYFFIFVALPFCRYWDKEKPFVTTDALGNAADASSLRNTDTPANEQEALATV
ncbi:lipid II flippase MurJ [Dictyobacter arantiisoli]|uniref:lipid II flippase MurJ n=1 Tax=Dictyobacter arantiisoli TaxID=2014874 RepID=UPI001C0F0792|nr:lipid II flippase MurJ [Dictyobacter arantiisoli]